MDRLVPGKKYRVFTRYTNAEGIFIGIGVKVISERQDPVFLFNGVTMMLPWQGIDRLELVSEMPNRILVSCDHDMNQLPARLKSVCTSLYPA